MADIVRQSGISDKNLVSMGSKSFEDLKQVNEYGAEYWSAREIRPLCRAAIRNVDFQRVLMYWHIGKGIFEEEQHGKERADYGDYLIKNLAKKLEPEYGSGFSVRILEISRQFYRTYPIANALRSQLNWSQYRRVNLS